MPTVIWVGRSSACRRQPACSTGSRTVMLGSSTMRHDEARTPRARCVEDHPPLGRKCAGAVHRLVRCSAPHNGGSASTNLRQKRNSYFAEVLTALLSRSKRFEMSLRIKVSLRNSSFRCNTRSSSCRLELGELVHPFGEAAFLALLHAADLGREPVADILELLDGADHTSPRPNSSGTRRGLHLAEPGPQLPEGHQSAFDIVELEPAWR